MQVAVFHKCYFCARCQCVWWHLIWQQPQHSCLSVTLMYCAKMTESIIMRPSPDCSPAILVFLYHIWTKYLKGIPSQRASNGRGVGKSQKIRPICCQQVPFSLVDDNQVPLVKSNQPGGSIFPEISSYQLVVVSLLGYCKTEVYLLTYSIKLHTDSTTHRATLYLVGQRDDWSVTAATSPDVVQMRHALIHWQQHLSLIQSGPVKYIDSNGKVKLIHTYIGIF